MSVKLHSSSQWVIRRSKMIEFISAKLVISPKDLVTGDRFVRTFAQTHLVVYPHGVDALQFTGPVLCLVLWDVWARRREAADH